MKKLLIITLLFPCILNAQVNFKIGIGNSTHNYSKAPTIEFNAAYQYKYLITDISLKGQYNYTIVSSLNVGFETLGKVWVSGTIGYGYIANLQKQDRHVINDTTIYLTKGISTNGLWKPVYQFKIGWQWIYINASYCYNELWYGVGMRMKI